MLLLCEAVVTIGAVVVPGAVDAAVVVVVAADVAAVDVEVGLEVEAGVGLGVGDDTEYVTLIDTQVTEISVDAGGLIPFLKKKKKN